jgi:hypothetical protein
MKYLAVCMCLISTMTWAQVEQGKDVRNIQFESLLIQGQVQRPDLSMITGNGEEEGDGLLRLREEFTDLMAADHGEVIQ